MADRSPETVMRHGRNGAIEADAGTDTGSAMGERPGDGRLGTSRMCRSRVQAYGPPDGFWASSALVAFLLVSWIVVPLIRRR